MKTESTTILMLIVDIIMLRNPSPKKHYCVTPRHNLNKILKFGLKTLLHVLGEHIGMKLSCTKTMSKVRGLPIQWTEK